ncbi:MAG TPA: hypothetical protein VFH17_06365 [Coriobacteriia bacterium]|nr:hypothetical protein [Coriobacteriia bacterium]
MAGDRNRARTFYAVGVTLGGLALVSCLALALSMSHTVSHALAWAVALVVGAFGALVALLLLDPQRETDTGDETASSCVDCGKPTRGEWRLCPHCGRVFECEMTARMGGRSIHG